MAIRQSDDTQQILSAGFAEMRQILSVVSANSAPLHPTRSFQASTQSLSGSCSPLPNATKTTDVSRVFHGMLWEASGRWQSWGLQGRILKSSKGLCVDYDAGLVIHLPLAWLFGSHALKGELSVRLSPLRRNTFTLRHPSYFTVARILGKAHPFLVACRDNDARTVCTMLQTGVGRLTDVDRGGNGALLACTPTETNLLVS